MNTSVLTIKSNARDKAVMVRICLTFIVAINYMPGAFAQSGNTLRNPLIPGAQSTAPFMQSPQSLPPPPGAGDTPAPVTPGHQGAPLPPPSAVPVQPSSPLNKSQVENAAAPYLAPPPSTSGANPGMLPATLWGYKPPALQTSVKEQGGLSGIAPVHKWGGQETRDYGLHRVTGSQTVDFGRPLSAVAAVAPYQSEDGPRSIGSNGAPSQPNRPFAQQTTDLYGNRILFRGNQRAVMTFAPY